MPRRHQRGRYLIRNLVGVGYVVALDLVLGLLIRHRREPLPKPITRVVVAIGGHLGDAVIASTVIPTIHAALPDAEIGILAPSWMHPVLAGHPLIARHHAVDHWKLNRSNLGRLAKWRTYWSSRRRALGEIKEARYDLAIDLYPFYPNMSLILLAAGVPARIGYESGGAGPAFTRSLRWTEGSEHMAMRFRRLLEEAGITADDPPVYSLPPLTQDIENSVNALMRETGIGAGEYVVLHMGTGHPSKALAVNHWAQIAREHRDQGFEVVLTGHGATDRIAASQLVAEIPSVIDLVGRTSINELRGVLRGARLVVGADSVAVHLAAAEGTPSISMVTEATDVEQWRPLAANAEVRRIEMGGGASTHA